MAGTKDFPIPYTLLSWTLVMSLTIQRNTLYREVVRLLLRANKSRLPILPGGRGCALTIRNVIAPHLDIHACSVIDR